MSIFGERKELSTLMLKLGTVPFSNAQIERDFSRMNLSKTKLQSTMRAPLLNALMIIRLAKFFFLKFLLSTCLNYLYAIKY